jgi:hypothetical protein
VKPAILHQRLAELYVDTMMGEPHSPQLTGLIGSAVKLSRTEALQAECAHVPGKEYTETHAGGRDRVVKCGKCGKTLKCEKA